MCMYEFPTKMSWFAGSSGKSRKLSGSWTSLSATLLEQDITLLERACIREANLPKDIKTRKYYLEWISGKSCRALQFFFEKAVEQVTWFHFDQSQNGFLQSSGKDLPRAAASFQNEREKFLESAEIRRSMTMREKQILARAQKENWE